MATQPRCELALNTLSRRIRESARIAGFTNIRALSSASGISRSGVSKIFNREHYPTFDSILALANACHVNIVEWVEDTYQEDEPEPEPEPQPEPEPEPQPEPQPADTDDMPAPPPHGEPAEHPADSPEPAPATEKPVIDVMALLHGMKPE